MMAKLKMKTKKISSSVLIHDVSSDYSMPSFSDSFFLPQSYSKLHSVPKIFEDKRGGASTVVFGSSSHATRISAIL